jgi:hypothetical protein
MKRFSLKHEKEETKMKELRIYIFTQEKTNLILLLTIFAISTTKHIYLME